MTCHYRSGADAPDWLCHLGGDELSTADVVMIVAWLLVIFGLMLGTGLAKRRQERRGPRYAKPRTWQEWWDRLE